MVADRVEGEYNMKLNRRNVLVGLGTIVAGGGAALGTGAFSSVEADRTVSIETAGDSDALLGLYIRDDFDAGGDIIDLEFADDSGLNIEARTKLAAAILVQNNGDQDDILVEQEGEKATISNADNLESDDITVELNKTDLTGEEVDSLYDNLNSISDNYSDGAIDSGEYTAFDLIIDLRGAGEEAEEEFDAEITIRADTNDS